MTHFAERRARSATMSRVALLGAGRAGCACADAVLRLGAERLLVVDRDGERAVALADRLNRHSPGGRAQTAVDVATALDGASGLIQATPVGMAGHPGMPLAERLLRPATWVSEIVYVPMETELLKAARRIGCATVDGGHMNVGQAVDAFRLFTGLDADAARMEAHFRSPAR